MISLGETEDLNILAISFFGVVIIHITIILEVIFRKRSNELLSD